MPDFDKLTPQETQALDALFDDARAHDQPPSRQFLDRVMDDALAAQTPPARPDATRRLRDRIFDLFAQLGGLPGASLIAACALFGLIMGYAGPDQILGLSSLSDLSAAAQTDLDAELDMFQTSDLSFDESELLQ